MVLSEARHGMAAFPKKMIAEFFKKVKKVIIVEELDPFLETEIKAMGYQDLAWQRPNSDHVRTFSGNRRER